MILEGDLSVRGQQIDCLVNSLVFGENGDFNFEADLLYLRS